jgi:hypothetical protein
MCVTRRQRPVVGLNNIEIKSCLISCPFLSIYNGLITIILHSEEEPYTARIKIERFSKYVVEYFDDELWLVEHMLKNAFLKHYELIVRGEEQSYDSKSKMSQMCYNNKTHKN